MAVTKELTRFTRDALGAGKSRNEISEALTASGWSASEVKDALGAWADTPFSPPIPRPQATFSARDFFTYALLFGLMFFGAIYLVVLLHALIDLWMDDAGYGITRNIRWAMAVLIVTTPLYLWLTVKERARVIADPALYRSAIRRWLTYLTLLASATAMLGNMMAVIYAFLNGDFTQQFLLKAVVVVIVAGAMFLYYLSDIRRGDNA